MLQIPKGEFFLGGNTAKGFYSLYDQILDPTTARGIYILKGGAGCGKSTLMKKISAQAQTRGLPVEEISCTGDPDSLDAVYLPQQGVLLMDGTAPHVMEPAYPGVIGHYVNLGECYDADGLQSVESEIKQVMKEYPLCYQRAYRCLSASVQVGEDMRDIILNDFLKSKIERRVKGILARESKPIQGTGQVIKRFLSAITHQGYLCRWETALALCPRVYELRDVYGVADLMLQPLLEGFLSAGYEVIACPNPLEPEKLEHLLIPEISLCFLSSIPINPYEGEVFRSIRLDSMTEDDILRSNKARLKFARKMSVALLEEAIESLAQAKSLHDDLEALYHPHVNFEYANNLTNQLIQDIFEL